MRNVLRPLLKALSMNLQQDGEGAVDGFRGSQGLAHIDDDQPVDAHLARDVDGHVVDDAAVDQDLALVMHGCKCAWHCHAGADGEGEVAGLKHDRLHGTDVGGDTAKRYWQIVETLHVAATQEQAPE
jgi:hypothetical protein